MSATITLGRDFFSGSVFHINEVQKNGREKFICCQCKGDLIVVKSDARKKDWHFRHPSDSNIAKCRNTALHDYAVQLIVQSSTIKLSKELNIKYSDPRKEVWVNNDYRSDVAVRYNAEELHFEVFVTHDMEKQKRDFYIGNNLKCCRIDLSDKRLLNASPEDIKEVVINQSDKKTLLGWEEIEPPGNRFIDWCIEHWYLVIPLIIYLIYKLRKKY